MDESEQVARALTALSALALMTALETESLVWAQQPPNFKDVTLGGSAPAPLKTSLLTTGD